MDFTTNEILLATAGVLLLLVLCWGLFRLLMITQRKKAQHLAAENRHRQEILQTQIEIQQQSFENVSREIHDNIGQVLSLIKLNLARVAEHTEQQPYHNKIVHTLELTGNVINDLRHLSKGLNPDFVQQLGLGNCIAFELERLQNTGQYETRFVTSGTPCQLPLSKEFVLYRVVQECFNNIIKHAQATAISVDMQYGERRLQITVADNGRGFDTALTENGVTAQNGSGINNMKKRMELVGGELKFASGPGGGASVLMRLHWHDEAGTVYAPEPT